MTELTDFEKEAATALTGLMEDVRYLRAELDRLHALEEVRQQTLVELLRRLAPPQSSTAGHGQDDPQTAPRSP
jgi:hypothetical protein